MGVLCRFGVADYNAPSRKVAMINKEYCELANTDHLVWNDGGSGADADVTLYELKDENRFWPTVSSLIDPLPKPYRLRWCGDKTTETFKHFNYAYSGTENSPLKHTIKCVGVDLSLSYGKLDVAPGGKAARVSLNPEASSTSTKASPYGRGVGTIPNNGTCPSGNEMNLGLCYTKCVSGYTGSGTMCYPNTTKGWLIQPQQDNGFYKIFPSEHQDYQLTVGGVVSALLPAGLPPHYVNIHNAYPCNWSIEYFPASGSKTHYKIKCQRGVLFKDFALAYDKKTKSVTIVEDADNQPDNIACIWDIQVDTKQTKSQVTTFGI